jgi:hypothetical protein
VRMEEKNVYLQRFQMTTGIEELPWNLRTLGKNMEECSRVIAWSTTPALAWRH